MSDPLSLFMSAAALVVSVSTAWFTHLTLAFCQCDATIMAGVAQLKVPLLAEMGVGKNWDQAH
jgi:hypothetical protein